MLCELKNIFRIHKDFIELVSQILICHEWRIGWKIAENVQYLWHINGSSGVLSVTLTQFDKRAETSYFSRQNRHAVVKHTGTILSWIWIESQRFPPDELFDIFLGEWWSLKIKTKRGCTHRLIIDVVKRCQVRVMQSLINCKKKSNLHFKKGPWTVNIEKPSTCKSTCYSLAWIKHEHSVQQITSSRRHIGEPECKILSWISWQLFYIFSSIFTSKKPKARVIRWTYQLL